MVVHAGEDTDAAVRALEPFLQVGPVVDQRAQVAPYPAVLVGHEGVHGGSPTPVGRSALLEHITPESAEAMARMLNAGDAYFMQLRQAARGLYLSFDTRTGPEVLAEAFPEPTLGRLRELKAEYDPHHVFGQNFMIPPGA